MELVGCTVFAWIWMAQATAARQRRAALANSAADAAFLDGIAATADFVVVHMSPRATAAAERIQAANPAAFHMRDEWFGSLP